MTMLTHAEASDNGCCHFCGECGREMHYCDTYTAERIPQDGPSNNESAWVCTTCQANPIVFQQLCNAYRSGFNHGYNIGYDEAPSDYED